jgi:hypothetical protein
MIPASYLYKDAYKQHWGEDFARRSGEEPWEVHRDAGLWEKPALWRRLSSLAARLSGSTGRATDTSASGHHCPEATDRKPALPA